MMEVDDECCDPWLSSARDNDEPWAGSLTYARTFLDPLSHDECAEYLTKIDTFLDHQAATLGRHRRWVRTGLARAIEWWPLAERAQPLDRPLDDIVGLTTAFDEPSIDLESLLGVIHCEISAAVCIVVALLMDRAEEIGDECALRSGADFVAAFSRETTPLTLHGAKMRARQSAGGRKGAKRSRADRQLGADEDLAALANSLLSGPDPVPKHRLVSTIIARCGKEGFGVPDHVRRRLQRLDILSKRKPT